MKESKRVKEIKKTMERLLKSWDLHFSFKGWDMCVNRENVSLAQLRAAKFEGKDDTITNVELAVKILLKCGLIVNFNGNNEALENRVLECMEEWRREVGSVDILHMILIRIMEEKHFFMAGQDMVILMSLAEDKMDKALKECLARSLTSEQQREESNS